MKKILLMFLFAAISLAVFCQTDSTAVSLPTSGVLNNVLLWLGTAYALYEVLALRIPTVQTWSTVKLIFGWIHSALEFLDKKKE
jgi:hypothetical protein